ncbi:STAS domain-containing protein [Nocardioides bigeumensis]|uniref:Anti-sigma factor antagonist n=1 Tax=Nocardioides bigeumensis TaxID=433657 RepID=A0ABN2YKY8_9ACTN
MNLEKRMQGQVVVLSCAGRLNMTSARALRDAVGTTVEGGSSRVVVDLTNTSFVDSSGLGALVAGLKVARLAGGDLRIAGASEQVRTVLNLTNLDRVLTPHRSVAEASDGW